MWKDALLLLIFCLCDVFGGYMAVAFMWENIEAPIRGDEGGWMIWKVTTVILATVLIASLTVTCLSTRVEAEGSAVVAVEEKEPVVVEEVTPLPYRVRRVISYTVPAYTEEEALLNAETNGTIDSDIWEIENGT